MIQEILKEYDKELPKAFHRGKETMPEFYRAFLEKSLKRVEEEAFKKEEPSQPLKEGQEIDEGVFVRKFKDGGWEVHGFNEDSAKEVISALKMLIPSQPIKEEEGECYENYVQLDVIVNGDLDETVKDLPTTLKNDF